MAFRAFASSLPPSLSLAGRTAIVTGSSSGIGRQTALHLARLGCSVLCADLQPEPLQDRKPDTSNPAAAGSGGSSSSAAADCTSVPTHALISRLGGSSHFARTDVSSYDSFRDAVAQALDLSTSNSSSPRLDYLINNAGIVAFSGGIENETLETFEKTMAVNVRGVYIGTKLAIEQMMKQEPRALPADLEQDLDTIPLDEAGEKGEINHQPAFLPPYTQAPGLPQEAATIGRVEQGDQGARGSRGGIINIGSIHGLIGGPGEPAYAAAKGAVVNFSRQSATDNAYRRIQVNCICPGYLDTAMTLNIPADLSAKRPTFWPHRGVGRDVAKSVVYLARDAPWVTGATLVVDGGTTAR